MSWLTAPIVKNSHILARIYSIFIKKRSTQTWKSFKTKFDLSQMIIKVVIK